MIVVDDDKEFADSLVELLEEESYSAQSFATPEAAFEWLLAGNRPSVVVLDLHTPGISAQRFKALLVSAPSLEDIPILMMSSDPAVGIVANAVHAAGAFRKPVDAEQLVSRIEAFCRERRSRHPA